MIWWSIIFFTLCAKIADFGIPDGAPDPDGKKFGYSYDSDSLRINNVDEGSTAENQGMKTGLTIVKVNDEPVETDDEYTKNFKRVYTENFEREEEERKPLKLTLQLVFLLLVRSCYHVNKYKNKQPIFKFDSCYSSATSVAPLVLGTL